MPTDKYITAIDPTLKRRVLFLVKNGWAISVITGYKFRYVMHKSNQNWLHFNIVMNMTDELNKEQNEEDNKEDKLSFLVILKAFFLLAYAAILLVDLVYLGSILIRYI